MIKRSNISLLAEANFKSRLDELGAILLEPIWLGAMKPHQVKCVVGHICYPLPNNVQQGKGVCKKCGCGIPTAEANFKSRLEELGAILLEPIWLGATKPHRVKCIAGHICNPRPHNVRQGKGICHICAKRIWDVFYIVVNKSASRVKFGITSGNPKPRLGDHARYGYTTVELCITDLVGSQASIIEQEIISTLYLAGFYPIKGREYYDIKALDLILKIVDHYIKYGCAPWEEKTGKNVLRLLQIYVHV